MQPFLMTPAPGGRLVRFVGDQISFKLAPGAGPPPKGWQARLRTNLGRGEVLRREIIEAQTTKPRLTHASWRDVPMSASDDGWSISFSLTEVGFFKAKAYAIDPEGRQHWPSGPDFGVTVHPDGYRTGNTIYCAFPRMFGETKTAVLTRDEKFDHMLGTLDRDGYAVIPPSGKLRDLIAELPHIVDTLGCRILHLLPITPTPTTYARFGRFGSPYAVQDLLAIDPALVVFDKRTTGLDQFRELTYGAHARGARVFLDVVINHTGWGSTLQENHPEWYLRDKDGNFISPGAWGVVWEDLAELDHSGSELWEHLGDVFIEWCRRGVDGFRCDAGYKIPVPAWRYITARVLQEFPETIFLLEGLGGSWDATEKLLTEGGMQWAYSELFQNFEPDRIAGYLDYSLSQSERLGLYVNYSETHDNDRLAKLGRGWSLLRNRLCALSSVSGAFGFTCGVEWLAPEKLEVHQSRGLAWGSEQNIIPELAQLNRLLSDHPCFFDNATITRLSSPKDDVLALRRVSNEGLDQLLVLVNTALHAAYPAILGEKVFTELGSPEIDLLGQAPPQIRRLPDGQVELLLPPGTAFCLAATAQPRGVSGPRYREQRAQSAWAITMISRRIRVRDISPFDWRRMAELVERGPRQFLTAVSHLDPARVKEDVLGALEDALATGHYPPVVQLDRYSLRRVNVVPRDHWVLIKEIAPFRAVLRCAGAVPAQVQSIRIGNGHVACFPPGQPLGDAELCAERYTEENQRVAVSVRFVEPGAAAPTEVSQLKDSIALLTNGRGGMARMAVDLGRIHSKYDCLLGANLHPDVPVDRHIFARRVRVWLNADGFVTPLDAANLTAFTAGPPAEWRFVASAGDERAVEVVLTADMLDGRNTTALRFHRPSSGVPFGRELPFDSHVSLIVRVEIEDRGFHAETHRNSGAEHHFSSSTQILPQQPGFSFSPATDRQCRVYSDSGVFHPEPEWSECIPFPVEASRGQVAEGDAYSPGWFELPLPKGGTTTLIATADSTDPLPEQIAAFPDARRSANAQIIETVGLADDDHFGQRLALAVRAFVAKRGRGRTVIAGYPWFLDWGRDTLICARGLLAAGMAGEVQQVLEVFGRFEEKGTLPNTIFGEDATNRDTVDAPLWYGVVCEDLAATTARSSPAPGGSETLAPLYGAVVDSRGRTIADILRWIAAGYRDGAPNGVRMDPASGLIWSPSHFTWMDTNFPAGTPREGYPVEIQVLWIRLLRQLARVAEKSTAQTWANLAQRAEESFHQFFWLPEKGWLSDVLLAGSGQSANHAIPDTALRSNCLFAISLGLVTGDRARRCVDAAARYLVVPGALRSLAPLPVSPALAIRSGTGQLLNDPTNPYWGRYEGDEDTRRKPAYHNGTAWTWTLPVFCEALARAWEFTPAAVAAARSYLFSMETLLNRGCAGHLPEIVDGDAPHTQRGCDAQAWGATEALRVWKLLNAPTPPQPM